MKAIIQGDVSLHPIKKLPDGLKPVKDKNVLAYGEITGHMHRFKHVKPVVFEDNKGQKYVDLDQETVLIHDFKGQQGVKDKEVAAKTDKHLLQTIMPGMYKVSIEDEYNPFLDELQQVLD